MGRKTTPAGLFLVVCFWVLAGCQQDAGESADQTQDAGAGSATQDVAQEQQKSCSVTMGWDPWEPYQYENVDNDVVGLDVELVTRLATESNCEINFTKDDWGTLLGMLKEGQVDIITGATKTKRRENFALFSDPYREESFVLYVRQENLRQYQNKDLQELLEDSFRMGITSGYIYGDYIVALQDNPKYETLFQDVAIGEDNFVKLVDMQIDGFLEDPFVATTIMKKRGYAEDIAATDTEVGRGSVHLMFSKASVDPATVDRFNQALASLRVSGEYQRILDRYRD